MALISSIFGVPPLSPALETNLTMHTLRHRVKGLKISMVLLLVMPFVFIDILRIIPKVYILLILSASFLLIIKPKDITYIFKIDKNHLLFSLLFIGLFFAMNFYQALLITLAIFYLYYLGTD